MSSEAAAYFHDALATAAEPRDAPRNVSEFSVEKRNDLAGKAARPVAQFGDATDELLVAEIREGAKEALGLLFRRYARLVRTVAMRILRDTGEADDLLQEVFLFVFRRAALFDPQRCSARSWLIQVAWHRAIDRRRHLVARHFYTNLELDDAIAGSEEPQAEAVLYERTMEGALGKATLRRIGESLSADQHCVLRLYFVEGHTLPEIAALIGQTPANVRNHYYRALEKMRALVFSPELRGK